MTTVKEIIGAMKHVSPEDEALIKKAYDFAIRAHEKNVRYSGEPYIIHPTAVAKHLASLGMDAETVVAGLLHDTIEDAEVTEEEVGQEFGPEVRFLVEGVTKLGQHKYRGTERHAESLRRLLVATSADVRVLIVKLADRYHNMTTIEHVPPEKRKRIALETLEIYAPLADRLGMGRMKRDLEDMSFPHIDPDAYAHAHEVSKLVRGESEAGIAKVQKQLQHALARRGMRDFKTEVRVKGLWSLHQKLKRKNDDITAIHDIAALRVIVGTIDDCYQTLGVIHGLFKPLPGEFKDYIAFPKPNGYQSLHTTVLTSDAGVVEMQVRTQEMHQRAQYGIASHMSYKQLGKKIEHLSKGAQKGAFEKLSLTWIRDLVPTLLNFSKKNGKEKEAPAVEVKKPSPKKKVREEQPRWLSELKDAHTATPESEEFVEGLKRDFFSHRVFVFTPRGDVVDLPVHSTPVDFAYAIHSELGNHMHGAKVNSKLVTFDTTLRNGDIVEILEKQSAKPTTKWLDFAKTQMARRHIRLSLEAEAREKAGEPYVPPSKAKKVASKKKR
ncbi:MAG: bifunctional (p)ppGpp synthetase/guanosine-3',5'-bis(diphosphate) 3'-pyrophosphohydrolase [Candidatus Pacebacteria bacterium]|nr:bifunctional (p)ppGpp synthetase/guanosine-3',5'-bis(diphosphate) 3'-pyrophosphohydrolase [Candidatus Paceibacterota bacterium]